MHWLMELLQRIPGQIFNDDDDDDDERMNFNVA